MKEFWKSVNICRSYGQLSTGLFFYETRCIYVGVYCFCIQSPQLVFHIVGYISTVVKSVFMQFAQFRIRTYATEFCEPFNQRPPEGIRMHQIRFAPGFCLGHRWGSHNAPPDPWVRWGGGYPLPPPHSPPRSMPSASRSRRLLVCHPTYFSFPLARPSQFLHRPFATSRNDGVVR